MSEDAVSRRCDNCLDSMGQVSAEEGEGSRQCYICLDSVDRVSVEESVRDWVSPCLCSGSMAWVHRRCLLRWVREHEFTSPSTPATCPQCLTRFMLRPEKGPVVTALEVIDKGIYPFCKMAAGVVLAAAAFDTACTTTGVLALVQVYGLKEAETMVLSMDAVHVVTYLHILSYSLLIISYVPWEDFLLIAMRKASRLPVLGKVLPADAPTRYYGPARRTSLAKVIASGVLLPTFAKVVGEVFFSSVDSKLKRVLLGGAAFLALKGVFYMYCKQRLMVRRRQLNVLPYDPSSRP